MKLLAGSLITLALVLQSGALSAQQGLGGAGQALSPVAAAVPRGRRGADGGHQSGHPPARLGKPRTLSRRQQDRHTRGRGVHGRFDYRSLAAAEIWRVLPGKELRRSGHQRADDAADAHQIPAGRHRAEAARGRHSGGHERHRRQYRPDDQRRHPEQSRVDGRAREAPTTSGWCSRASRRSAPITRQPTFRRRRRAARSSASRPSTRG